MEQEAISNKCIATSNKCLTSSNKKLLGTRTPSCHLSGLESRRGFGSPVLRASHGRRTVEDGVYHGNRNSAST